MYILVKEGWACYLCFLTYLISIPYMLPENQDQKWESTSRALRLLQQVQWGLDFTLLSHLLLQGQYFPVH